MATGPDLSIDIAEKRFAGAAEPLFANLRFTVVPRSVVAIVGPSGIGKSTLLRMVAGIDGDFTGSIRVGGVLAREAPPPGFVFQDARLLPWLSAGENIRAAAPTISAEDAGAALRLVGLGDAAHLYPHQLSGGMQRRVAIARALAVNARLLLLDEPFVSLDRVLLGEIQQLFSQVVAETRPTVLFVSHLTDDAARLADRAILLDHRPADIIADLAFEVPPGERNAACVAGYRAQLDRHFGGGAVVEP